MSDKLHASAATTPSAPNDEGRNVYVPSASACSRDVPPATVLCDLVARVPAGLALVDDEGEIRFANAEFSALYGYDEGELLDRRVEDLQAGRREEAQGLSRQVESALRSEGRWTGTFRGQRKNGSEFWADARISVFAHPEFGRGMVIMQWDATGRRQVEFHARWCEAIIHSSEDAVISKAVDGIVTSWNAKAEDMFGYRADEMVGRSLLALFPDDRIREEHEILRRIRRGETVSHFETVRLRKDGEPIDVSVTISPIMDERGEIVGASTFMRDISARKRADEELLKLSQERAILLEARTAALQATEGLLVDRTAELHLALRMLASVERRREERERKRLSQELHDEVGQALTALTLNLESARRKADSPPIANVLASAIQTTEDVVRSIRRIVNQLRLPQLDESGLVEAVRWQLDVVRNASFLDAVLVENIGGMRFLPEAELALFRIVQEAITNVMRHASARHLEIRIERDAGTIRIQVIDDGVGYTVGGARTSDRPTSHFGERGMRERALAIGAHIEIISAPGAGCRVIAVLPLAAQE